MKYPAEKVARRIISALKDRHGFDAAFDVGDDIFDEIVSEMASIIREHSGAFADNGDEIAAHMHYDAKHACPTCGGSGHVDDARQTHPAQTVSVPDAEGKAFISGLGWVVQCSRAYEYVARILAAHTVPAGDTGDAEHWKGVPGMYWDAWSYEYDENRNVFKVTVGGFVVAESEESEIANAICASFNAAIAKQKGEGDG